MSASDTTPTPIISPIGWIATQDNLWILGSLQHAYSNALSSQPWYAAYVPSEAETRMSLRKRKPTILQDQALDEDDDELLAPPPRKRARTRRTTTARIPRKKDESSTPDKAAEEVPDEAEAGTVAQEPEMDIVLTRDAKRERIEMPVLAQEAEKSVSPEPRRSQRKKGESPASSATTLTRTHSRESSTDSVEGAESVGSSTVCEEEPDKEKVKKGSRADRVIKRLDKNVEEDGEEDEAEEAKPAPAKRSRTSASRARPRSRVAPKKATSTNSNNTSPEEGAEHVDATPAPPASKPKSRPRTRTRRR